MYEVEVYVGSQYPEGPNWLDLACKQGLILLL